jgi:hypothetical protein
MHRQRIPKLALAMGAAAILIPSLPSKTQAASGTFYYVRADNGRDAALSRTPDGQCLRLPGGASYVQNDTNADANLYEQQLHRSRQRRRLAAGEGILVPLPDLRGVRISLWPGARCLNSARASPARDQRCNRDAARPPS